ncbi:MAG: oxidoreductase [Gammaproteobacteria bacterium]
MREASAPAGAEGVDGFFVVAREPGAEHPALPTWANRVADPVGLAGAGTVPVERRDVPGVPGAFHLLNLLDGDECARLVALTERLGYLPDAAVSLPRSIRHNDNLTWVADDRTLDCLWQRAARALDGFVDAVSGKRALGLNGRLRFYRYGPGDYFAPHTDGAWPGSRVVDGELVTNAFPDRFSQYSLVLFLSTGFVGGATAFYLDRGDPTQPARSGRDAVEVAVTTPLGAALCFPHGLHPRHCLHSSTPIEQGTKYIVRTDILFEL